MSRQSNIARVREPGGLFSVRPHWAARLLPVPVLPTSAEEMRALGWKECDVVQKQSRNNPLAPYSWGSHFPYLYFVTILCEAPDEQGSLVVPAPLVDGFLDTLGGLGVRRGSRLVRFRRHLLTRPGGQFELYLGSAKNLEIIF